MPKHRDRSYIRSTNLYEQNAAKAELFSNQENYLKTLLNFFHKGTFRICNRMFQKRDTPHKNSQVIVRQLRNTEDVQPQDV